MLEKFRAEFFSKLGHGVRWDAFFVIASELCKKNKSLFIGETGSVRDPGSWMSDGNSTLLWDWLIRESRGVGFSVDIDPDVCQIAKGAVTEMRIVHADSVKFLLNCPIIDRLDLIYLDSYDWSVERQAESSLHHAAELSAVYNRLPAGCLIAVDDCHKKYAGKHVLVQAFFEMKRIQPILESYITIWKKP